MQLNQEVGKVSGELKGAREELKRAREEVEEVKACEACLEYIKRMKSLEFRLSDLQRASH